MLKRRVSTLLEVASLAKGQSANFLLVLDSLHSWVEMLPDERASEYEAINDGLASLRLLANQLVCLVLVIAERNRSAMKEGGINAGAGSRRIEFGSESVASLPPVPPECPAELVAKIGADILAQVERRWPKRHQGCGPPRLPAGTPARHAGGNG